LNIGLTQRVLVHNGFAYDATSVEWYTFLKHHTLSIISNRVDQDFEKIANTLDALIITGGDDSTVRRIVETKLTALMMKQRKPVLGVCHGAFLLTHLCGGVVTEVDGHHNVEHQITCNNEVITVNSYHTLQISQPHKSATVLATCDGVCESWIDGTLAAIVWHPERMKNPVIPNQIKELFKWNTQAG
jgi:gamma-glutamyl-gamma-aminobutyrate hydrolase PuuD